MVMSQIALTWSREVAELLAMAVVQFQVALTNKKILIGFLVQSQLELLIRTNLREMKIAWSMANQDPLADIIRS